MMVENSQNASMRQVTFQNQITTEHKGKNNPIHTQGRDVNVLFIHAEPPPCQRKLTGTDQYKFFSSESSERGSFYLHTDDSVYGD